MSIRQQERKNRTRATVHLRKQGAKTMPNSMTEDQISLERYLQKQKILGKADLIKFRVLDDKAIQLVKVEDTESTGTFVVPSFVSCIKPKAFEDTRFTRIILNNKPDRTMELKEQLCRMEQQHITLEVKHPEKIVDLRGAFYMCQDAKKISLPNFDWQGIEQCKKGALEEMFRGCRKLEEVDLGRLETLKPKNTTGMFSECFALSNIDFLYKIDFQHLETAVEMFRQCVSIRQIDLSKLDLKNLKQQLKMFQGCSRLQSITTGEVNTENLKNMQGMFELCGLEEIDLDMFNTSKLLQAQALVRNNIHLKRFKCTKRIESLQDIRLLFQMCYSVDSIDLRGIALNKVKSDKLFHMCNGIGKLTVNEQDKALVMEMMKEGGRV